LPDQLTNGAVNPNATFFNIPVSKQAMRGAFQTIFDGFGFGDAGNLGLFDLTQPYTSPAGAVPANPRYVNSDFTPTLEGRSNSITGEVKQKVNDCLMRLLLAATRRLGSFAGKLHQLTWRRVQSHAVRDQPWYVCWRAWSV